MITLRTSFALTAALASGGAFGYSYDFGTKRAAIAPAKRNYGGRIRTWVCPTRP